MNDERFDFVVDTRSYAGNFERELCIHLTGHSDIDDFSAYAIDDATPEYQNYMSDDEENVVHLPGGNGDDIWDCPMQLYQHPESNNNNSVGIHFQNKPSKSIIEELKQRAKQFDQEQNIKITGFRLIKVVTTYEEEEIEM